MFQDTNLNSACNWTCYHN